MPTAFEQQDFKKISGEIPQAYIKHNRAIIEACGVDSDGDGILSFREFSWWWCTQFDLWDPSHKVSRSNA